MKTGLVVLATTVLWTSAATADERNRIIGDYVEARTAEVFAGGCIMNSEAETAGCQAVIAWRITSGAFNGVALDGLVVAAAVAGDRNLGMREMGGEAPHEVRAVVTVDERATMAQRDALVQLARVLTLAPGVLMLTVNKETRHDPSCGAMQWFKPFSAQLISSAMGTAEAHAFTGTGLDTKWSAPHKRSAFFGTFSY